MEPYIEYGIKGIKGYDVLDSNYFVPDNDSEINKIEIKCDNGEIVGVKFFYKENQEIDVNEAQIKVEQL